MEIATRRGLSCVRLLRQSQNHKVSLCSLFSPSLLQRGTQALLHTHILVFLHILGITHGVGVLILRKFILLSDTWKLALRDKHFCTDVPPTGMAWAYTFVSSLLCHLKIRSLLLTFLNHFWYRKCWSLFTTLSRL